MYCYRRVTCDDCALEISNRSQFFSHHLRQHSSGVASKARRRLYVCSACDTNSAPYSSRQAHHFWRHCLLRHSPLLLGAKESGQGPGAGQGVVCAQCERVCTHERNLTAHIFAVHMGVGSRVTVCDECGLAVRGHSKRNTFKHFVRHHVTRDASRVHCDSCGAAFLLLDTLVRHVKTQHLRVRKGEKMLTLVCDDCSMVVTRRAALFRHSYMHHLPFLDDDV